MHSLKRLLEIKAEKERRKEEKAKIKAEKEAKQKEELKEKRKRKLRQKQNKRYYDKIKKAKAKERKELGDRKAYFMILIVKNNRRVKRLGAAWWINDAYKIYNSIMERNKNEVKFPVIFRTQSNSNNRAENKTMTKWELLLVEKIKKGDDNVTQFRDENGKFINVQVIDHEEYKIIAKNEWRVEEKFNVYGYHPKKDRKDYTFILNELFLNKLNLIDDVIRVNVLGNKLLISYSENFDFVICKNNNEAERLYTAFQNDDLLKKNKSVIFFGDIVGIQQKKETYDKIMEKTGWDRALCIKSTVC